MTEMYNTFLEDSVISGINVMLFVVKGRIVQTQCLPGKRTDDVNDYIKSSLKKAPDDIILHIGTNETPKKSIKNCFRKTVVI